MDTSKEYIEMCEKVKELQGQWIPEEGDFYWNKFRGEVRVDYGEGLKANILSCRKTPYSGTCAEYLSNVVWLPRQDQLQKILLAKNRNWVRVWNSFNEWTEDSFELGKPFTSMEQLWLGFVMKEKFKKTWNGKDWVTKK